MKKVKNLLHEANDIFYQSMWIFEASELLNNQRKYDKLEQFNDVQIKLTKIKYTNSNN